MGTSLERRKLSDKTKKKHPKEGSRWEGVLSPPRKEKASEGGGNSLPTERKHFIRVRGRESPLREGGCFACLVANRMTREKSAAGMEERSHTWEKEED